MEFSRDHASGHYYLPIIQFFVNVTKRFEMIRIIIKQNIDHSKAIYEFNNFSFK